MDLNKLMDPFGEPSLTRSPTDSNLTHGGRKDAWKGSRSHKRSANKLDRSNMHPARLDDNPQRAVDPGSNRPDAIPLPITREGTNGPEIAIFNLPSREMSREPLNPAAASSARPSNQGTLTSTREHNRRSKKARAQRSGMKKARTGPLVPIGKLKAHLMRKLHVCEACRRKKVSCDARRECLLQLAPRERKKKT